MMSIIGRHRRKRAAERRKEKREEREKLLRQREEKERYNEARKDPFSAEMAKIQLTRQIELEDAHRRGERLDEKGMSHEELERTVDRYYRNK